MISPSDKKRFRAIGHHLKPVVTVAGKGLNEGVRSELERALNDHELIKIKLNVGDRTERKTTIAQLGQALECEIVQTIGNMALIYRAAKKANPALSNISRSNRI